LIVHTVFFRDLCFVCYAYLLYKRHNFSLRSTHLIEAEALHSIFLFGYSLYETLVITSYHRYPSRRRARILASQRVERKVILFF
uniref:Ovule protein n=1 Tax=Ascaris lumbricoides TaxID=6252 RepID=A0A0M3IEV6_ASCLU